MRSRLGRLEKSILDRLVEHGYEAMIVGGAVRDWIIGKPFTDIDIATNAPYDKLVEIMDGLGELKFAGSLFGVLLVGGVEVATYRSEVCKDNIVLELDTAPNAHEDSKRRDFTINSIYYEYKANPIEDRVIDFHNGSGDIREAVIKAVGNPYERFNEDYSRILRAIYLSATLMFDIDDETGNAIVELGHNIKKVPYALQGKIVRKAIKDGCFHSFLKLLEEYDLLQYIFPEITHTVELKQNPEYHCYDVWNHTLKVVEEAERNFKGDIAFVMGAFLHDVGKGLEGIRGVNKKGYPSDIGHEEAGVPIAKKICKRLELGKDITNEVAMYVCWHGVRMNTTEKSVKQFLFKLKNEFRNIDELKIGFFNLLDFMWCDAKGFDKIFCLSIIENLFNIHFVAQDVFDKQIFYSSQFNFDASVIAKHPNVKQDEIRGWIEFFIRNNITEEEAVLKILNKQGVK